MELNDNNYIVAGVGPWSVQAYQDNARKLPGIWRFVDSPDVLWDMIGKVTPKYIFFTHWRWIVPLEILQNYECVCFHMTDVPYGRGGSPLQNLIERGHKETKLSALRMTELVDGGPVYAKEPLVLDGSAEEIYHRAMELSWFLIERIVTEQPQPKPQEGEAVLFHRRTPEQSVLPDAESLEQMYDFIRMLDAPGYPKAFVEYHGWRLEFDRARIDDGKLTATVTFTQKGDK